MIAIFIIIIYNIIALLVSRKAMTNRMSQLVWVPSNEPMGTNFFVKNDVLFQRSTGEWVERGAEYGRSDADILHAFVCGLFWPVWLPIVWISSFIRSAPLSVGEKEVRAKNLQESIEQSRRELEALEKEIM